MTATVATAMSSMAESQRAMQAAAAQAARGNVPPLRLQEGRKPSVKATKEWLRKVAEKLQDVPGMVQLVEDFIRDPRSFTKADMHVIDDPGGHIMMQVKGAAYGVYKKMGGKESEKVGVLLYNIYTSSWRICCCSRRSRRQQQRCKPCRGRQAQGRQALQPGFDRQLLGGSSRLKELLGDLHRRCQVTRQRALCLTCLP